jgi:hypothetical protein
MSTLKRDHDLKCAIESQAAIGGRILEFIDAHLAFTLSDAVKPVELVT